MKQNSSVIITGPRPTQLGGVANYVKNILGSEITKDFHIKIFYTSSYNRRPGFLLRTLDILYRSIKLYSFLKINNIKLLHINPSFDFKSIVRDIFVFLPMGLMAKSKILIQFHGGRLIENKFVSIYPVKTIFYYLLEKSDLIIVLSNEQYRNIKILFGEKIKNLNIIQKPLLFVDFNEFSQKRRVEHPITFLFMGRIIKEKGVLDTIKAFSIVKTYIKSSRLFIAGSGQCLEDAKHLTKKLGLTKSVFFLGYISGKRKSEILSNSDIFVLPTFWNEGFPYSIIEAMAAGLPVITSPNAGIKDLLIDSVNGFLIPPRNPNLLAKKMIILAKNEKLRKEISQRNKELALKNFSAKVQVTFLKKLYNNILLGKTQWLLF